MSTVSSGEEYHSAEEREVDTGGGNDTDITSLSRGLEGACLSEKDGGSVRGEVGRADSEASSSCSGSRGGTREVTELRNGTEPGINRTAESTSKEKAATHDGGGEEQMSDKLSDGAKRETKELTEEVILERKEQAGRLKAEGNDTFKRGEYAEAVQRYTEAIEQYPSSDCAHEMAICYANRAACHLKLEDHQSVVDDCSKALELKDDYLKAYMRRAQACEALEKYEEALEDYKRALELDPSQVAAGQAMMYLPEKINEQREKLKAEMLGKLKELGNAVLNPFGLSTDNFQFQKDPNTGGYSVNFKR